MRATETLGLAVALLFAFAYGCAAVENAPATSARSAYRGAVKACEAYELAPGSLHDASTDRVCRSLRLVCTPLNEGAGGASE